MPILAGEKSQFSSLDGGFLFSFYHHKQINGKKMSFFFLGGLPDWLTMVLCKHQKHQEKFGRADPFCMAQLLRVQLSMWIFRASTSNGAASQHSRDIASEINIAIRTNYNDLTATSLEWCFVYRELSQNYPKLPYFRPVSYYNLPRAMDNHHFK